MYLGVNTEVIYVLHTHGSQSLL